MTQIVTVDLALGFKAQVAVTQEPGGPDSPSWEEIEWLRVEGPDGAIYTREQWDQVQDGLMLDDDRAIEQARQLRHSAEIDAYEARRAS